MGIAHIDRLRSVLQKQERVPAAEYADLLRAATRQAPLMLRELPRDPFQYGIQQAYQDDEPEGIVAIALFGATMLDALGRHEEALAHLDQAITMVSDARGAARLLSGRAWIEVAAGLIDRARQSVDAARSRAPEGELRDVAIEAVVSCMTMDRPDASQFRLVAERAWDAGDDPIATSSLVQVIAFAGALGDVAGASAAATQLHGYASEVGHRARELDSQTAQLALAVRSGVVPEVDDLSSEAEQLMNNHVRWKASVLRYRWLILRGQSTEASDVRDGLAALEPWMSRGYHNSLDGLDAYRVAFGFGSAEVALPTPAAPTLFSLPNILASAEAIAIGGSLSAAAEWIAWLGAELPAYVVTSLEWPACRTRVEALLWLRLGQRSEAIERLRRAIVCCEERGDSIEAAIGRAQLAAIEGDVAAATEARQGLAEFGIDASRLAGAAVRVVERARLAGGQPFTVDEGRALARLVRGCSQREIEAELELRPRGAARLLSSSYRKLGVRGRIAAIEVARERQVA